MKNEIKKLQPHTRLLRHLHVFFNFAPWTNLQLILQTEQSLTAKLHMFISCVTANNIGIEVGGQSSNL